MLVIIVYDSVRNSVFESQVLRPLFRRLDAEPTLTATIISYESDPVVIRRDVQLPQHERLELVYLKRHPLVMRRQVKRQILAGVQVLADLGRGTITELRARGPIAGYIALVMLALLKKDAPAVQLTIQARGLCGQEHRYTHQHEHNPLKKLINWYKIYLYENIERMVYGTREPGVIVEAVSSALKQYLVENFYADQHIITIAQGDLVPTVTPAQRQTWRAAVRDQLQVPQDAHVVVYSGSYKPWQCVDQTLEFFKNNQGPATYFFIFSRDTALFNQALERHGINREHCRVRNINDHELLMYLAAADTGMLLREQDVINWVSRPTKLLEYQAVGLVVEHNNTIALLVTPK